MSALVGVTDGDTLGHMEQDDTLLDSADTDAHDEEIVDELLIEEISIDGMCGVY